MIQPNSANLTEVYYKPEKTAGIEQIHANWKRLRIRSEALVFPKQLTINNRLNGQRGNDSASYNTDNVSGTLSCILSPIEIDELLESTLRNNWNAKQLAVGDNEKTFSILLVNQNAANEKYYTLVTGAIFTTASISVQVNSYVTFTFNVIAEKYELDYTLPSRAILAPSLENEFFIGFDANLSKDGTVLSTVSSITSTFGFSYNISRRLSFNAPIKFICNEFESNASISAVFNNISLLDNFNNETSFTLTCILQYKGYRYTIIFPRCVTESISYPSAGVGAIVVNINLVPLVSKTQGTSVILRKESI